MGLKSTLAANANATPAFESESETENVGVTADVVDATPAPAPAPSQAKVTAAAVPAVARTSAVAKSGNRLPAAFRDIEYAIGVDDVMAFSRVAPSVTAEGGSLKVSRNGTKQKLGRKIRVRPVSSNPRWFAVPGSNDKEAKELVRSSYDKEMLDDGVTPLDDYIKSLQAKGYDKARIEPYLDLWVDVVWTETDGDIPMEKQELTRLQLPKTSMGNWAYFCGNRGRLEKAGIAQPLEIVEVHCEDLEGKSGSYSNMSFHAPQLD